MTDCHGCPAGTSRSHTKPCEPVSSRPTPNEFPPSRAPRSLFAGTLEEQEEQLRRNPLLQRMNAARREKADDRYRPRYHYVNPEYTLNDPTGCASGQGRWHLFYHARPPEDPRQRWGHAVSPDLIRWRDLPTPSVPDRRSGDIRAAATAPEFRSFPGVRRPKSGPTAGR